MHRDGHDDVIVRAERVRKTYGRGEIRVQVLNLSGGNEIDFGTAKRRLLLEAARARAGS